MKALGPKYLYEKLRYISKAFTNKINVFKMGKLEDRMGYSCSIVFFSLHSDTIYEPSSQLKSGRKPKIFKFKGGSCYNALVRRLYRFTLRYCPPLKLFIIIEYPDNAFYGASSRAVRLFAINLAKVQI